ncbi:MAG: MFS transporter [Gammaproteobacteria bacterium]|nr:MFS transporter [Gammaproteobacteria bacterium]
MSAESAGTWRSAFAALMERRAIAMLFLGFSAGLPLLLIFGTLSVWLREAGVDRATVTFFSWAALGYSFKFVWAPLVDRLPIAGLTARLGRRRGWLLLSQIALAGALLLTSAFDPQTSLTLTAAGALIIGFCAATQDIVIDAYRIESAPPELQSMLSSMYIAGYRIGMLVGGAGALQLASAWGGEAYVYSAWRGTYQMMALAMLVGIITTLCIPEPAHQDNHADTLHGTRAYGLFVLTFAVCAAAFVVVFSASGASFKWLASQLHEHHHLHRNIAGFLSESGRLVASVAGAGLAAWLCVQAKVVPAAHIRVTYIAPVADFLERHGRTAVVVLLLIGSYRIADIVMGAIANVFYLDAGYTKDQIATYSKFWGLWATIAGGFLGGILSLRFGVYRILFLGAVLAAVTNLLFAWLAMQEADTVLLAGVIIADNLSAGLAGAAFVAYLSSLTNVSFTAMQYALFSSIMTLLPKLLAGYSGTMVDAMGYERFFILTALLGLPVLLLTWLAARLQRARQNR